MKKTFFETDKIVLQNSSVFGTYNDKSWPFNNRGDNQVSLHVIKRVESSKHV